VEALGLSDGKTKSLVGRLAALGLKPVRTVVVVAELTPPLVRATRNVPWLEIEQPTHVSVYQLLRARQVLFDRPGFTKLEEALGR
jgi:large subunit ribosomal protein L4